MLLFLQKKALDHPCPFCGNEMTIEQVEIEAFLVKHDEETDCSLNFVKIFKPTEEAAIELWNRAKVFDGKLVFEKPD